MSRETVTLEIFRYRPEREEEPTYETFEVPYRKEWMVLDALHYIKDRLDGSLSYRWACRMGVCGSCGMTVDGTPVLTCATYLEDLLPGPIRVAPLNGFPVTRDLVGDIRDFIGKMKRARTWLVRDEEKPLAEGEYLQIPEQLADYKQYSMCINCLLCYAACPIYELEPHFVGPAALALAQRYNMDSRDQGRRERMSLLSQDNGIWACTFVGECSVVCPKNVDPAGAIQRYKLEAAADWFRTLLPWGRR
ncbi:MAG: succinate dehydrogenase/fumarate reductase iron-sulfur subunit [Thermoanaerobaculia bacterium]